MNAPEPGPERLDQLLDGRAEPRGPAERELMALARELRDGSPPASAAVRARVRTIAAGPRRRRARLPRSGWGRAALALAPACAVAVVVVVLAQGGGDGPPALTAAAKAPGAALEAAPTPSSPPARSAAPSPVARARALVAPLGGSVRSAGPDASGRDRLVVRVPADRARRARAALRRLGAVTSRPGAPGVLVVTLRA